MKSSKKFMVLTGAAAILFSSNALMAAPYFSNSILAQHTEGGDDEHGKDKHGKKGHEHKNKDHGKKHEGHQD